VTLTVVDGDAPAGLSDRGGEVPRLRMRPDVSDPLVVLSSFLSLSPPSAEDELLAGRWLDTFLGMVDACRGRCDVGCPADGRAGELVCRIPWDDRDAVDWVALAVDQACGCVVSDEGALTFARAVDKRLMRDEEVAASALVDALRPEADKVVIISYADANQAPEVLGEGLAILRGLPEGFLQTGRQMVCNKSRQVVADGLLGQVVAGEPLESSPVRSTQRARLQAARVVWLHNALKRDVRHTLACLPAGSGLVLHLLGHGTRQGLQTHERVPGQGRRRAVLRARDLQRDPRWRQRRVKLLYLSFSSADGSVEGLLGHPHHLPRQLLPDSPRVAATVCLRWALPRTAVRALAEAFYDAYWEEGADRRPNASRALLEARREVYARWRGDEEGRDWRYYCAWAAPMLISQDATVSVSSTADGD
jgi:hypothetical protein